MNKRDVLKTEICGNQSYENKKEKKEEIRRNAVAATPDRSSRASLNLSNNNENNIGKKLVCNFP